MAEVIIIGGGVVGLLTALELTDRGAGVLLLDAGQQRPPASWAGGGILSALFPWRYSDPLTALTHDARGRYEALDRRLCEAGEPSCEVTPCGLLMPHAQDWSQALDWAGRWSVAMERVPAPNAEGPALWMPEVAHVRNPRLLKGLRGLLGKMGVAVRSIAVDGVQADGDGWCVRAAGERWHGDRLLVCAGAASARLLAPLGWTLPVMPVKGEMLLYEASVPAPPSMILGDAGYVIPRRDGRMLVGSTLAPGCEDQRPTEAAQLQLRQAAADLWPPLATQVPMAHWTGLRPGSPRDIPWLGPVPGRSGLFVASGHYRNGLVSAPASAALMASLVLGLPPEQDPAPYSPSSSLP